MAESKTLARPYVKAAFEYAQNHSLLEEWHDMLSVAADIAQDPGVAAIFKNPAYTAVDLLAFWKGFSKLFSEPFLGFLRELIAARRLFLLPAIAGLYQLHQETLSAVCSVRVVSAQPLSSVEQQQLQPFLCQQLDCKVVQVSYAIDEQLLGGVLICIGDRVIDYSMKGHLDRLKAVLVA
jgi:F-type H+-transporting ATPase subunit delta